MNETHRIQRRRTGVTPGVPTADSFQHFLPINNLMPGSSAFVVPVFYDYYAETAEPYFFGMNEEAETPSVQLYDPFYICCAFGPEDINIDNGWVEGDIVLGRWSTRRKRYEVAYPYGLTRLADLSEGLTVGGDADAILYARKRDGTELGSAAITVYHWGDSSSETIPMMPIIAHYQSSARRWYTDAFYRT